MHSKTNLGFDDWFQSQLDANQIANHQLARIISVHKESYMITSGEGESFAELSGTLLYTTNSALDLPTVGDWVYADFYDDDTHAIIHGIVPRKTLLKRKAAGKLIDFQLIAANIDIAFIMQSSNQNFNLKRLERYLVMVNESGITPIILLSKCDLIAQDELDNLKNSISITAPDVAVIAFSNLTGTNIDTVKAVLSSGSTCCLLGSSGVGKTTLVNSLVGKDTFETQAVSKKQSKGKHTTTHRELIRLTSGAMLIDTPGMRELGNLSTDLGMEETFSEIVELAHTCKFSNCSHTTEKGCAILAAIESGELSERRYKNYTKMKKESAFNEMSYIEKRKKDKSFGKMVKSAIKKKNR